MGLVVRGGGGCDQGVRNVRGTRTAEFLFASLPTILSALHFGGVGYTELLLVILIGGYDRFIRFKVHETHPDFIPKNHGNKLLHRLLSLHHTHKFFHRRRREGTMERES